MIVSINDLKTILQDESITCVIAQKNILHKDTLHGLRPIMNALHHGYLEDALVADNVIGKAAAMMIVLGNARELYADIISEHAYTWLQKHEITVTYHTLVPYIINRSGDGMCPMEACVLTCEDEHIAHTLLAESIRIMNLSTS